MSNSAANASSSFGATDRTEDDRVKKILSKQERSFGVSPSTAETILKALGPALNAAIDVLNVMWPKLEVAFTLVYNFFQMVPQNVLWAVYGLALCFFGGYFAMSVAAIEAFRQTGWDRTRACLQDLNADWQAIRKAQTEDNSKDENNDGVADVKQIGKKELLSRKLALLATTVNPDRVTGALGGLWTGFLGVISVLRLRFALVLTLGVSIGEALRKAGAVYAAPALAKILPPEYHKWISVIIGYTCKTIGVSLAWIVQQIVSTVQSAIQGGLICSRAVLRILAEKDIVHINPDETMLDEVAGWLLAGLGCYFQLTSGLTLPFPYSLVLFPLSIVEWILSFATFY